MSDVENSTAAEWLSDPEVMLFAGPTTSPVGAIAQHGVTGQIGSLFGRTRDAARADWIRALDQLRFLLDDVEIRVDRYELEEVTFGLAFSAEGRIVFVAHGGIETTITAKFRLKQPSPPAS